MNRVIRKAIAPAASFIHGDHMEVFGLRRTMRAALACNRWQYGGDAAHRDQAFHSLPALLDENGPPAITDVEMRDGWALDRSGRWPHLPGLLEAAADVIAERGLTRHKPEGSMRSFFQSILKDEDVRRHPAILDFVLSSDVLSVVCRYLRTIPVLSATTPQGVRLAESSIGYDDRPERGYRSSQLYHLDHHGSPMVYVIVLLREVTARCGPFTFLPASTSDRVVRALNYQARGVPYRVKDAEMYRVIDAEAKHELKYPAGTVLFIDSSRCFHYGSRDAVDPRYQMMYAFTNVCRTDFTEWFLPTRQYPIGPGDSRLRRLVLDTRSRA
jgi:hypothetical protein